MELAEPRTLPPATGQRDSPQPPVACPEQPREPPAVSHPQHTGRGLCQLHPGSVPRRRRDAGWGGSSSAVPKSAPGSASRRAEERADAQGGLPAVSTPARVPVRSPGGHLGVRDLGGFLGQAAALGGDQVVVLGHVLVRVVQAAGAGPGWGPRGQTGRCSACVPSARGWATWGQLQRIHRGTPFSPANPIPKTLIPLSGAFRGADQGHPLGIQALPAP